MRKIKLYVYVLNELTFMLEKHNSVCHSVVNVSVIEYLWEHRGGKWDKDRIQVEVTDNISVLS